MMRLMISPGAVSMNIDASPATGRKPRAVVPMNARELRLQAVEEDVRARRVTSAMGA